MEPEPAQWLAPDWVETLAAYEAIWPAPMPARLRIDVEALYFFGARAVLAQFMAQIPFEDVTPKVRDLINEFIHEVNARLDAAAVLEHASRGDKA